MNPDLSHLAILASFARSALRSTLDVAKLTEFWDYDRSISEFAFIDNLKPGVRDVAVCKEPSDWIRARLQSTSAQEVILGRSDKVWNSIPRSFGLMSERSDNSPVWFVEFIGDESVELWLSEPLALHESFYFRSTDLTKYWGFRVRERLPSAPLLSPASAREQLDSALRTMLRFAEEHRDGFAFVFRDALSRLDSCNPEEDFAKDPPLLSARRGSPWILAPAMASLESRQIVSAASSADYIFHFSGMMSWFDHFPEPPEIARQDSIALSSLQEAIDNAITSAVNFSSSPL